MIAVCGIGLNTNAQMQYFIEILVAQLYCLMFSLSHGMKYFSVLKVGGCSFSFSHSIIV